VAIKIPRKVLAEIILHSLSEDPDECCGILLGKGDQVSSSRPVENTHPNKVSRYSMDPLAIMKLQKEADEGGDQFVAIYHSHTYTQGYPSETDVNNAVESGWTDPYYVLVSLVEKTRPVVRAYRITEKGEVMEQVITTDGRAYRGATG
jgi:proteasome lid subunit RPN8/RPN11